MQIGSHHIQSNLVVAPMAGVTDRPFRQLCKRLGAGLAISEMVASNPKLRDTGKSQRRMNHDGEVEPIVVQIAGADPAQMADSARYNVDRGAQIIDINMGCPAKKVCNVAAGSALLQNESLVGAIVERVVAAVDVPVTLKIRTGWALQYIGRVPMLFAPPREVPAPVAATGKARALMHKRYHVTYEDITALVAVDFAAKAINFAVPGEHRSLKRWYDAISSGSSMAA